MKRDIMNTGKHPAGIIILKVYGEILEQINIKNHQRKKLKKS